MIPLEKVFRIIRRGGILVELQTLETVPQIQSKLNSNTTWFRVPVWKMIIICKWSIFKCRLVVTSAFFNVIEISVNMHGLVIASIKHVHDFRNLCKLKAFSNYITDLANKAHSA